MQRLFKEHTLNRAAQLTYISSSSQIYEKSLMLASFFKDVTKLSTKVRDHCTVVIIQLIILSLHASHCSFIGLFTQGHTTYYMALSLLGIHYKLLVFWTGYFYLNILSSQITTRTHCCTIATPSATAATRPEIEKIISFKR